VDEPVGIAVGDHDRVLDLVEEGTGGPEEYHLLLLKIIIRQTN
jgi:hypothetical protein